MFFCFVLFLCAYTYGIYITWNYQNNHIFKTKVFSLVPTILEDALCPVSCIRLNVMALSGHNNSHVNVSFKLAYSVIPYLLHTGKHWPDTPWKAWRCVGEHCRRHCTFCLWKGNKMDWLIYLRWKSLSSRKYICSPAFPWSRQIRTLKDEMYLVPQRPVA